MSPLYCSLEPTAEGNKVSNSRCIDHTPRGGDDRGGERREEKGGKNESERRETRESPTFTVDAAGSIGVHIWTLVVRPGPCLTVASASSSTADESDQYPCEIERERREKGQGETDEGGEKEGHPARAELWGVPGPRHTWECMSGADTLWGS